MKKFILFDNDGVLVDTEKYYFKANQELFQSLGYKLSLETYKDISLRAGKSVLDFFMSKGYSKDDILNLRNNRDKIYEQFISNKNLALPGVSDKLKELSNYFEMGIVTSTKKEYFNIIHSKTEFTSYFNFIIAREDYKISKPNPEPYLLGIEKSGLIPSEILVIEDTPRGLEAAKAAGLDCLIITNDFTADAEFKGAKKVLQSIHKLTVKMIKEI
jgi:HAD superfamily hydrolase (TIGR01509 family)